VFRLVNVAGRSALEVGDGWHDLARVAADPTLASATAALARHAELHALTERCRERAADGPLSDVVLGPVVPDARQVFGIGLNYRDHAAETGAPLPSAPLTFTKFPSCLAGPTADVPIRNDATDYEAEVVAVIGTTCVDVDEARAWDVVAGLTAGQDVSDRALQFAGTPPQFSLGKSARGFGPIGPAVVSLDAITDLDDVPLSCELSGELVQSSSTSQLVFSIPALVAYLSSICTLYPGDLVFTGTPAGVGVARGRLLRPGDEVVTRVGGVGELRNRCVAG
jgi:2-keto-4-pentenoate hydratase/2-oxohepta-3-ene-1,7-dioic acid hydratase in catechol pathway